MNRPFDGGGHIDVEAAEKDWRTTPDVGGMQPRMRWHSALSTVARDNGLAGYVGMANDPNRTYYEYLVI